MLWVPNQPGEQHGQVRPGQIVAKYHVTVIVADHDAVLLQILGGALGGLDVEAQLIEPAD